MEKKQEKFTRDWYLIDLDGQTLGRISTRIADLLNGKNRPDYMPNLDRGAYVVAINASGIKVSGNKAESKRYYNHSGFIGNLKVKEYKDVFSENPEDVIRHAVAGMLPKNKLAKEKIARLKVYKSAEHPHVNVKFIN